MKISAYFSCSLLLLAALSCAKKSDKDPASASAADAEIAAADSELCAEFAEDHEHEPVAGYTASAKNKFHVKVDWSSPLVAGELTNSATVTFHSPHGEELPLTLSSFKLFMPSMGHGSIKTDKLILKQNPTEKYVWSAEQIYFSMGSAAGEWVVDIEGSACGITDKARVIIQQQVQ